MKEIIVEAKLTKALSYEMQARGELPDWFDVDNSSVDLHYFIYPIARLRGDLLVKPLEQYAHEFLEYDKSNNVFIADDITMDNIRADIVDYLQDNEAAYDGIMKWFLPRAAEYIARISWFLKYGEKNEVVYTLKIEN